MPCGNPCAAVAQIVVRAIAFIRYWQVRPAARCRARKQRLLFRQSQTAIQARARKPRCASNSTARSGMVNWKVAPIVPSTSLIWPPCARTSSAAMTRPSPVPPLRAEP